MRLQLAALAVFGAFTVACSSGDHPSKGEDGAPGGAQKPASPAAPASPASPAAGGETPGCKITLSGAQTGDYPCVVSSGYDTQENRSVVSILKYGDPSPYGGFIIEMAGEAAPGAVSFASAAEGGFEWKLDFMAVYPDVTPTWFATKDPKNPSVNRGDFSMNLTSVAMKQPIDTGKIYEVHGTMRGTLPFLDATGAKDTIDVTITF